VKIALVLEKFDPHKGGLENWTWQFAQQLHRRGFDVHIVAFEFDRSLSRQGITLHPLERVASRLDGAAAMERYLRTQQFDIIHDMGCGWYADIFHPHGGSTVAHCEHNLMRIPRWRQIRFWREKRYREAAEIERRQHASTRSLFITVSRMVQRHFAAFHQLPPDRMRLIYNGVDTERFSPDQRPVHRDAMRRQLGIAHETLFLMLAHNLQLKNAATFIKAAAKLSSKGDAIHLLIAGCKNPQPFIKLAERLGASRIVTFLNQVDDPIPCYAAADVLVHPTWYDPCSLVTLEAWACGLPVITTTFNGASELMTNGKEGHVLSAPDNIADLVAKMEALCDQETRKQMGAAARELALLHPLELQTNEVIDLYQALSREKL
jgi:UDP-glucose:(heptosyl)LPS alpha-1,3-glucosyltransferase